jgi:hypothetical protein
LGKVQLLQGLFLKPWGHLEVMVEYVVAPIRIILNNIITHAHISGSKHTPSRVSILKH